MLDVRKVSEGYCRVTVTQLLSKARVCTQDVYLQNFCSIEYSVIDLSPGFFSGAAKKKKILEVSALT